MKKILMILLIAVIVSQGTLLESSSRFGKQFGKSNWKEKYTKARKKISSSKIFNYVGGSSLTGASFYYLNEKIKNLDLEKLRKDVRQNQIALKQLRSIAEIGSRVILCDTYAPIEKICKNRITQEIFKGIITDPNPKTENLRKKLKQLKLLSPNKKWFGFIVKNSG